MGNRHLKILPKTPKKSPVLSSGGMGENSWEPAPSGEGVDELPMKSLPHMLGKAAPLILALEGLPFNMAKGQVS